MKRCKFGNDRSDLDVLGAGELLVLSVNLSLNLLVLAVRGGQEGVRVEETLLVLVGVVVAEHDLHLEGRTEASIRVVQVVEATHDELVGRDVEQVEGERVVLVDEVVSEEVALLVEELVRFLHILVMKGLGILEPGALLDSAVRQSDRGLGRGEKRPNVEGEGNGLYEGQIPPRT